MGVWEEHWMQFISGLNQEEKNKTVLGSLQYFNKTDFSYDVKSNEVYSFESKLSVSNLATRQTEILLLCPSFSCNLLTTLYLYASEHCLLGLFLLFLCYISLVVLCLLLCFTSYHHCFHTKNKGQFIKGPFSPDQNVLCHQCTGQREIIINVNEAQKAKLPPPASSQPKTPPPSVTSIPTNENASENTAYDDVKSLQLEKEPQQHKIPLKLYNDIVVLDDNDSASQHSKNSQNSIEVLAMHLATHLTTVQSLFESSKNRKPFGHAKKETSISNKSSKSSSNASSVYLSDLPLPPSLSSGSTATERSMKKLKKHSILCFPLSINQSAYTLAFRSKPEEPPEEEYEEEEEEFQRADEDFLLSKDIPQPSNQVPPYMLLNRFGHQLPEATENSFEHSASSSESP